MGPSRDRNPPGIHRESRAGGISSKLPSCRIGKQRRASERKGRPPYRQRAFLLHSARLGDLLVPRRRRWGQSIMRNRGHELSGADSRLHISTTSLVSNAAVPCGVSSWLRPGWAGEESRTCILMLVLAPPPRARQTVRLQDSARFSSQITILGGSATAYVCMWCSIRSPPGHWPG